MKAIIIGATGLTGSALTDILLNDAAFERVVIIVRKATGRKHSKLTETVIDFDRMAQNAADFQGDVLFNCMGTTLAAAGSQAAQQVIDRDYPIAAAHLAAAGGAKMIISVSAIGTTDVNNSNFYLRTKAEMEAGIAAAIGNENAFSMRPSFLVGDRSEFRLGERIGLVAMKVIDHVLLGGLRQYRSIDIHILAKAMANIAKGKRPAAQTVDFDEIVALAK